MGSKDLQVNLLQNDGEGNLHLSLNGKQLDKTLPKNRRSIIVDSDMRSAHSSFISGKSSKYEVDDFEPEVEDIRSQFESSSDEDIRPS